MQTPEHPAAAGLPANLPRCIPLEWRLPTGAYMLAYPRTPYTAQHWLVMRMADASTDTDTLATVDDFGDLVETHRRNPASLMAMGWQRLAVA